MADYSELEQPGIEVLQVFQTESATVITPTLAVLGLVGLYFARRKRNNRSKKD